MKANFAYMLYLLMIILCSCSSENNPKPSGRGPGTGDSSSPPAIEFTELIWPLDHALHDKVYISNYVDINGNPNQTMDYQCAVQHTYDGHTGTDIALLNFRIMDQGIGVVAAADGIVTWTDDSNYDRNYWTPYVGSHNGVVIEYPDKSYTAYAHMRKHSVAVKVGEVVKAGDFLGFVGSSGTTPIPHLHFANRDKNNAVVDPYEGSCGQESSFWVEQGDYVGYNLRIYDADIFLDFDLMGGYQFGEIRTFKDRPIKPAVYGIDQELLGLWVQLQGNTSQKFTIEIVKPDGSVFTNTDRTIETKRRYGWYGFSWDFSSIDASDFGTWVVNVTGGIDDYSFDFEVGETTEFGPRFYPLAGKSIKLGGGISQEELRLHESSPEVTFELIDAPPGVSIAGNLINFGAGQSSRNHHFQVKATDSKGRFDLMYYHLLDLSKSNK